MFKIQSQKDTLLETTINVSCGMFITFILNLTILPYFAMDILNQSLTTALIIGVVYTTVSLIRSYVFRRVFTRLTEKNKRLY